MLREEPALLPLTPAPNEFENVLGYALRLAAHNGLPSPCALLQSVGARQNKMRKIGFDATRLAPLVGSSEAAFAHLNQFIESAGRPCWHSGVRKFRSMTLLPYR